MDATVFVFFFDGELISTSIPVNSAGKIAYNSPVQVKVVQSFSVGRIAFESQTASIVHATASIVGRQSTFGGGASCEIIEAVAGYATASIVSNEPSAPTDAYAAPVAMGAMAVEWEQENPETIDHYEIAVSDAVNGIYDLWQNGMPRHNRALIQNLPMATAFFMKVRSVGLSGKVSDWCQVKLGKIQTIDCQLIVTAISGSIIMQGASFSMRDKKSNQLITMVSKESFTV